MRRIGHKAPVLVVNDALVALEAGAGDGPGIVLIAGTGSICYGRNEEGQAARAGGWGYMLGDEGSGWWIGRRALSAVMRQFDGRGPATLADATRARSISACPSRSSDLVHEVYYRDTRRRASRRCREACRRRPTRAIVVARQIIGGAAGRARARRRARWPSGSRCGARSSRWCSRAALFRVLPTLQADVSSAAGRGRAAQPAAVLDVEPALGAVRLALAEARGGARFPQYI